MLGAVPGNEPAPKQVTEPTSVELNNPIDLVADKTVEGRSQSMDIETLSVPMSRRPIDQDSDKVEKKDDGSLDGGLDLLEVFSVDGEEEGVAEDGTDKLMEGEGIESEELNATRDELVKETLTENSLANSRKLADRENGYQWDEGLLMRYQLDDLWINSKRLCLPRSFRERCMVLAHDKFGHRGKNKVAQELARKFCWPTLWRDVASHCRACTVCQQYSKAKLRHAPMTEREVVTVPYERVCIGLVGPLPKAKGGCEYMLTCIDVATRWPETVPLRRAIAPIKITHLVEMFSRNGFPGVIVSDNGPQFIGKVFETFCKTNGIQHTTTSVYCPESNGILERFHGTLKQMVTKCAESKGSWPEVLPMCLCFLRMTPCSASGFSPFLLTHGWEPYTPAQLLYNAWMGKHVGEMSVEDWVRENCERVQQLRDEASAKYHETSEASEKLKDKTCRVRTFEVGQSVWYRTSGLSDSLHPSWEGPYVAEEVLGPLSYRINVDS